MLTPSPIFMYSRDAVLFFFSFFLFLLQLQGLLQVSRHWGKGALKMPTQPKPKGQPEPDQTKKEQKE